MKHDRKSSENLASHPMTCHHINQLKGIIGGKKIIPTHQFVLRNRHSIIDQIHRKTNIIEKIFEREKKIFIIFLDEAQIFDKVCHKGLIQKLN